MDHEYFMKKALIAAEDALLNKNFPVGSVIVYEDEIIANGVRMGVDVNINNETDHAEIIALKNLESLNYELNKDKLTIYSTLEPCLMCYGAILIGGIKKIVYAYEDAMGGGTKCDLSILPPLYKTSDCNIIPNILRDRSLKLFQKFFSDSSNNYLQNSFLAKYTLDQKCSL